MFFLHLDSLQTHTVTVDEHFKQTFACWRRPLAEHRDVGLAIAVVVMAPAGAQGGGRPV